MKVKRILIAVILIIACISTYNYLKLRQEYRLMAGDARNSLVNYLNSSLNYAHKIDFTNVDKEKGNTVLMLANMHSDISNSYQLTRMLHEEDIAFIDYMDMQRYQDILSNDLNKAAKNELKKEDIDNFKLLTEDIRLIYRYVNSNKEFGMKKYNSELRPNLKALEIK